MYKVNKDKMDLLNIKNHKFAKRFYKDLSNVAKDEKEKEDIFSDFLLLVYDCQQNEQDISQAIPDYKEFFSDTIKNIKKKSKVSRLIYKSKKLYVGLTCFILIIAIGMVSWFFSDAFLMSRYGFQFYLNSDKFVFATHKVEVAACEIDLKFLGFNEEKIIYDDGNCKIYINSVSLKTVTDIDENLLDCFYTVDIFAVGKYTSDYGRVVCGVYPTEYADFGPPQISYIIDGESFIAQSRNSGILNNNAVYLSFTINGGLLGEKAKKLYEMDKINIEFDGFYVNEWFRK